MITVTDGDFGGALRSAVSGLSREKLADGLEREIERIEDLMEGMAEDSTQEAAMEAWDLYLCSLQMLEHYFHNDDLTPERLERIYGQADLARTQLAGLST